MLKFGIVTNINEKNATARVQFQEDDGVASDWLPILQVKTLRDKFYILPDIGEQVACLMDENLEDGVILGAIYSAEDVCPVFSKDKIIAKFQDGSNIEINKSAGDLSISFNNIKLNGKFILNGVDVVKLFNAHNHNETNSVTQAPNQRLI